MSPREGRRPPRRPAAPRARPRPVRGRPLRGTPAARARPRPEPGRLAAGARTQLRGFRQATVLAVAVTALLLLLLAPAESGGVAQPAAPGAAGTIADAGAEIEIPALEAQPREEVAPAEEALRPDTLARLAAEEAAQALRELWIGFLRNLPKYLVALFVLLLAWAVVRLLRPALRRVLRGWERAHATVVLVGLAVWLLALGIAVSVLVGDIRALVGSLGLVGLALSWALQTPIESFTGWLLNSFQGYYRVGDRVAVGEVFGDVYRIDVLTTTVWEIGGPDRSGFVHAEQPTGRLITFPNYEVLRGSIVNFTRDFPFVWDELDVPLADRSDLGYAAEVLQSVAERVLGEQMAAPAREYERILRAARLEAAIADRPQVFVALDESWTTLTIRYLVGARERRRWKSELTRAVTSELNRPEHAERILAAYPRRQLQLLGPDGRPRELPGESRSQP